MTRDAASSAVAMSASAYVSPLISSVAFICVEVM
jgi:hypothetical protein